MTTNLVCSVCGRPDDKGRMGACRCTVESLRQKVAAEKSAREKAEKELADMRRYYRKPTHGPCCTCQACGQHYDDCRCDLDEVAGRLEKVERERDALAAKLTDQQENLALAGALFLSMPDEAFERYGATVGQIREAANNFLRSHDAALTEPLVKALNESLDGNRGKPDAELLGRLVRDAWIRWARKQENPKPHWLTAWEHLDEPVKEVDREIGLALYRWALVADSAARSISLDTLLAPYREKKEQPAPERGDAK